MGAKLEATTNVVLTGVALLVAAMLIGRSQQPPAHAGYERDDTFPPITGVEFNRHQRNVLLVMRSSCEYCTASMGFYRSLIEARDDIAANVGVVALTTESLDTARAYVASNQLRPDALISVTQGYLEIPGTPYIILVDSAGTVLDTCVGQLQPDKEAELMTYIVNTKS